MTEPNIDAFKALQAWVVTTSIREIVYPLDYATTQAFVDRLSQGDKHIVDIATQPPVEQALSLIYREYCAFQHSKFVIPLMDPKLYVQYCALELVALDKINAPALPFPNIRTL